MRHYARHEEGLSCYIYFSSNQQPFLSSVLVFLYIALASSQSRIYNRNISDSATCRIADNDEIERNLVTGSNNLLKALIGRQRVHTRSPRA